MSHYLTIDEQATLLRWAAARIGQSGWRSDSEAIGLLEEGTGRIVGVAVLNMFHDETAWLHLATDGRHNWASRERLANVLAHAFLKRKVRRLVCRIDVHNVPAQILALKAGFTVEGRERCAFQGRDVAIFAMLRDECTWLEEA